MKISAVSYLFAAVAENIMRNDDRQCAKRLRLIYRHFQKMMLMSIIHIQRCGDVTIMYREKHKMQDSEQFIYDNDAVSGKSIVNEDTKRKTLPHCINIHIRK